MKLRIVDVVDEEVFGLVPPCADPGFDHRSCDYWEDADRGSKAARSSWLEAPKPTHPTVSPIEPSNPFAPTRPAAGFNPFAPSSSDLADNPFASHQSTEPVSRPGGPRKLGLLTRGQAIFGSYAKVALDGDDPVAYAQFGPLSAYPRASALRQLYPQLPQSPPPAVITCIATTAAARRRGHAMALVEAVVADLGGRGFAAIEAYPAVAERVDETSAATVEFWARCGFNVAIADERFPVMRRELA